MSPILIPSNLLRETKRLFIRLKHTRAKLPVLTHILLTAGPDGIHLTVTDLDHWLQTCVSSDGLEPVRFLIPPAAMDAACRADRASLVSFTTRGGRRSKELGLVILQGGIEASSVHPTLDPKEFPEKPAVIGEDFTVPPATIQNLSVVAGCASQDSTRQTLNGVYFTPEDGGRLVATDGRLLACCPAVVPPHATFPELQHDQPSGSARPFETLHKWGRAVPSGALDALAGNQPVAGERDPAPARIRRGDALGRAVAPITFGLIKHGGEAALARGGDALDDAVETRLHAGRSDAAGG